MKTYNETVNTVFERIDEYKTAQKRKKKIITHTAVPACCIALAAMIGIGVWQSDVFKSKPSVSLEDSTVIGEKDYIGPDDIDGDWYGDGQEAPPSNDDENTSINSDGQEISPNPNTDNSSLDNKHNHDPAKMLCYINQIGEAKPSDVAPPQPVDAHYYTVRSDQEAVEYLGINFEIINAKYNLQSSLHGTWYKKSDNTLVWDLSTFCYSNEKGNFTLEASKTFKPISCYSLPTEEVISTMVGTKNGPVYVKFYGTVETVMSQNYSDKQSTILAEFQNKGVYFRIEANNISAFDFYQFVSAVANG